MKWSESNFDQVKLLCVVTILETFENKKNQKLVTFKVSCIAKEILNRALKKPLISQTQQKIQNLKAQSCLTLCDPVGYTAHWILQARRLEWVAFSFL